MPDVLVKFPFVFTDVNGTSRFMAAGRHFIEDADLEHPLVKSRSVVFGGNHGTPEIKEEPDDRPIPERRSRGRKPRSDSDGFQDILS